MANALDAEAATTRNRLNIEARTMLLNKTPEQWSKVDAEKVSRDSSSAHVMHLIADAKQDIITLADELEQYRELYGPLCDEPDNPYKYAETPFADNH